MPRKAKRPTAARKKPARRKPAPTPTPTPNRKQWHKAFLSTLAQIGNVSAACQLADVDRTAAYRARNIDEVFKRAWDDAIEESADVLEREAFRRAVSGVDEPVFGSGGKGVGTVQVGTVRKYSDTLLIFLLKGVRPEKFRERHQVTHEGQVGNVVVYLPDNGRQAAAGPAGAVP